MIPKGENIIHIASVSGGKDSTAVALLMLDQVPREQCRFVFADTGNEHSLTYDYLDYLRDRLGIEIDVVRADFQSAIGHRRRFVAGDRRKRSKRHTNKAKRRILQGLEHTGNPFLDMAQWKGRFPSRRAQFCTVELKTKPITEHHLQFIDDGFDVWSWRGVRRQESAARRNAKQTEDAGGGMFVYQPIVDWSAQEVVAFVLSKGIELNPLYKMGMNRVGCMPCINCSKSELRRIADRFPDEIDRIEDWEQRVGKVSKRQESTFFPATDSEKHLNKRGIRAVVEWSKTSRGGQQYDLLTGDSGGCISSLGLCE